MSATKCVLHHHYRQGVAYDWSGHANHGDLDHVGTSGPVGTPPGLWFSGDPRSKVDVRASPSLRDFGELRMRVIFRVDPEMAVAPYMLVEAHQAFELFVDGGELQGMINSPSAGWSGTWGGNVTPDAWHTADFVHDGISRARLWLDGTLVGDRHDAHGPIPDPRGISIGHWLDEENYEFFHLVGVLDQVQIWKDDPERDAGRVIDDCCLDREWVDQRVDEARRRGWTAEQARASLSKFFGAARAAAAEARGGDPGRTAQINQLTEQALSAMSIGNTVGLEATLTTIHGFVLQQLGQDRMAQLGNELLELLRAGPLGIWMGDTNEETVAFFEEIVSRSCLGGIVPERPRPGEPDERDHPPERLPEHDTSDDTDTDVPVPPDPPLADEHVEVPEGIDPDAQLPPFDYYPPTEPPGGWP